MKQLFSAIPLAQTIVEASVQQGIEHVVISPGSRNAPLTIGFSNHPSVKTYSIVDERCAGFFALGIAQQIRKPVAVVCTSGSALLNYYPAVSEAFYSDIPLVVISADRPSRLIDIGDGQTIRQEKAIDPHVLYSACLKEDNRIGDNTEIQKYNEEELAKALSISFQQQGPVHINAPFDEPLYGKSEELFVELKNLISIAIENVASLNFSKFIDDWNASEKRMLLVGVQHPDEAMQQNLNFFGEDESTIVFTEVTSNTHHASFFASIDAIVAPFEKSTQKEELFEALQPDILVTFGGMIVSKKVKSFLRKYPPKKHYHIDAKKAYDTFFTNPTHIAVRPQDFFKEVIPSLKEKRGNYTNSFVVFRNRMNQHLMEYSQNIPYTDFKVFYHLVKLMPTNLHVQYANSSTIRYANLFPKHPTHDVFCNRGTSGIDGSTSTAIGASLMQQKPSLLVTGDLSFLYDSNAMWNNYIPPHFKVIIINNSGGGIFRILPGDKHSEYYQTYFETTHQHTAIHLAKMYGFNYECVHTEDELIPKLKDFYSAVDSQPSILEIFTPRELNDEVLLSYFKVEVDILIN